MHPSGRPGDPGLYAGRRARIRSIGVPPGPPDRAHRRRPRRGLGRRRWDRGRAGRPGVCSTQSTTAAPAPGATLRFYGDPDVDAGERTLAVQHRFKGGARYWLRITQAGRLIGQLRYYTAFRAQRGRFAATWVIAPEAAFEAARCRRPRREDPQTPLGFRKFPIPPCLR
jgi:hypothetical protein